MNTMNRIHKSVVCRKMFKILLNLGVIVGFLGFFVTIGAIGSIESDRISFRNGVLVTILGVAMMTGGIVIGKLVYEWEELYKSRECSFNPELTSEDVVGLMTYMKFLGCWVVCVDYDNEHNWKFCVCSESGKPISTPIQSNSKFSGFIWTTN